MTASRRLTVTAESFPIRGTFRISRGAKTEARVVTVVVEEGDVRGWGECVPYARYGESVEGVVETLRALAAEIAGGMDRHALQSRLPPGAARNALDCALWDLDAKLSGTPVWRLAGLAAPPGPLSTAFTLSIDTPDAMRGTAAEHAGKPLLKLKLAGDGLDLERVAAVKAGAPSARLIVDANEGWTVAQTVDLAPVFKAAGVEMIEQPLPASADEALRGLSLPVRLGADESAHGLDSLPHLTGKYQVVNVKLDKTGGLTEALAMVRAARAAGMQVMLGCMVGTSLAMAPAALAAQGAEYVDLDGPLLLARDRDPGLTYQGTTLMPPEPPFWG